MAIINWNNGKPSFDYANNAALGVNLSRQVNAPLDVSSEFSSVKDMLYYVTEGRYPASGTGVSDKVKSMTKYPYLGQIIALVDTDAETVAVYYIKTAAYDASLATDEDVFDHYFAEVGKATIGDDKSIVLDVDTGILSLNDYGVQYYAYDSNKNGYASTPTVGWKAGLIPQVISDGADGTKLAWFESNPTTVEGLQTEITTIKSDITGINTTIGSDDATDSVKGRIKTLENTTVKTSGDQTIEGTKTFSSAPVVPTPTDAAHAANKGYVDSAISGLGSVFELKAVMDEAEFNALAGAVPAEYEAGDVILVTITDVSGNDTNKEYVVVADGETKRFELLGDPSGVTALDSRLDAAESSILALDGRMDTAETNIGNNTSAISDINTAIGDDSTADSIKGRINANKTAITALDGRMDTAETNIGNNTSAISDINADIGSDAVADSIKGRINANKTAIDTINTKLDTVAEGAQVNVLEKVELGKDVTGTVEFGTGDKAKTQTINITKVSNAGTADTAKATEHTLTVFSKTFNGSADVTVTETDIGAATDSKLGLVKSSTGNDHVAVATDGTMTVSKVSSSVNADNADKVTASLTFGSETYNGSVAKEITLEKLGFDSSAYARADQGTKADSAIQSITIAGKTASGTTAVIEAKDLADGLGLGSASYKADTYFATATALNTLDGEAVKITGDQTISGTKTFNSPVVVATPTADNHATTKKYVDDELAAKMSAIDAMTFKGLLGEGEGNVASLPTDNVRNGDTYKVITAGTYADQKAKVGDMFIALVKNTSESTTSLVWTLIPSGDENNGNVMAGATLTADQLVVGNGSQDVKTLAAGTNGQHLVIVGGKPTWADPDHTTIASDDDSIDVKTGTSTTYSVEVKNVNANLISQTEGDYLILDGGSSTINI